MTYLDGFRNGRADKRLGFRLIVALHANLASYAIGYRHGWLGLRPVRAFWEA